MQGTVNRCSVSAVTAFAQRESMENETVTARLLAELRAAGHSWYRIARLLRVSDQNVSKWRKGAGMSPESARAACAALGRSERETAAVLAALAMDRAGDDDTRKVWAYALKRLGGLAAGVLIALGGGPTPPAGAAPAAVAAPLPGLCIMLNRLRRKHRRGSWVDTIRRAVYSSVAIFTFSRIPDAGLTHFRTAR